MSDKRPEKIYNFMTAKIGLNARNAHGTDYIIRTAE